MKYLLTLLLCLPHLLLAQLAQAFGDRPYNQGYDPARNAAADYQAALTAAKAEHKMVLLEIGGNWCIWCMRLDKFVKNHTDLHQAFNQTFVAVKVNFSEENENTEFLKQFPQVKGYPHFMVVNPLTLKVIQQGTGKFEEGKGYSEVRLLNFIRAWQAKLPAGNSL